MRHTYWIAGLFKNDRKVKAHATFCSSPPWTTYATIFLYFVIVSGFVQVPTFSLKSKNLVLWKVKS